MPRRRHPGRRSSRPPSRAARRRRGTAPTAPIAKSTALSPRYQVRGAVAGTSYPPLGQRDRSDDGDEQQDRRQLERQEVGGEQPASERGRFAEALGQTWRARRRDAAERRGHERDDRNAAAHGDGAERRAG